jgi:hypothetical protein
MHISGFPPNRAPEIYFAMQVALIHPGKKLLERRPPFPDRGGDHLPLRHRKVDGRCVYVDALN